MFWQAFRMVGFCRSSDWIQVRRSERSQAIRERAAATAAPRTRRTPSPRRAPQKRGRAIRIFGAIVLLLVIAVLVAVAIGWSMLHRPAVEVSAGAPVEVEIKSGSSTAAIAEVLASAGVVENALMFRVQSRLTESDGLLRAGVYTLSTGMPYNLVLEKLKIGPDIVYYDVPIPEGFTAKQIAERFAARAQIPEAELVALVTSGAGTFVADHPYLENAYGDSLEGFLFPATYRVKEGTSAHDVVEMMLDKFDSVIADVDLSYAKSKNLDLRDVVIIASILERESKIQEEFPLVSSVIYNRLAKPMRLQLCATVLYKLPEGTTKLTNADTKIDSPYNTYIHDGLPVGPISNPGLAALTAAAEPAKTKYYYYVLTGKDGSQTFASTYDEFLRAKQVYQDVFGE